MQINMNTDKKKIMLFSDNKKKFLNNNKPFIKSLPSTKQWRNSVYLFNKNQLANIFQYDKLVTSLSNSFYNMFVLSIEKKIINKNHHLLRKRFKRLSIKKIFVSKPDIKHSNDKVLLTFYTYNKHKIFLLNKISQLYLMQTVKITKRIELIRKLMHFCLYKNQLIKTKLLNYYKTIKFRINNNNTYTNLISILHSNKRYNSVQTTNFLNLEKYLLKLLEKELLNNYYKLLLYINKNKFNEVYLMRLATLFTNIYNKKIEFNIINLKYLYLSSDIMSKVVKLKLKNRKNRVLKVLHILINVVELPKINKLLAKETESNKEENNTLKSKVKLESNNINSMNPKKKQFLSLTNYKIIAGIRMEASGRLTRRLTASRAINKFRYKGSLKNIDSSYKGFSSEMVRNQLNSNLDVTQINSKTRNGTFGLNSWVAHI